MLMTPQRTAPFRRPFGIRVLCATLLLLLLLAAIKRPDRPLVDYGPHHDDSRVVLLSCNCAPSMRLQLTTLQTTHRKSWPMSRHGQQAGRGLACIFQIEALRFLEMYVCMIQRCRPIFSTRVLRN